MLRPFFEAYEIVADVLRDAPAEIDEKELTKLALGVGRQYVAQDRVRSNEAVSALLFATARQVAADQHLLEPAADLDERRTAFRDELRGVLRDMDKVERISREQFYRPRDGTARAAARRPSRRPSRRYAIPWSHDHTLASRMRSRAVWPVLVGVALLAGVTAAGIGGAVAGRRADRHRAARPGPGHHLRPAVRAGGGGDRRRASPSGRSCSRRSWCRRSRRACSTPPDTARCDWAPSHRAIWAVCAALLVPLTVSDVTGQPLSSRLSPSAIWSVASLVETAGAWRWTALLAAIVTVASIPVLRWSWTPLLFAGSLVTLLPLALTGHSSAGGSHDLATNSLLIHLIAGALWAGGLLALLVHAIARR